jgi:hypothetical protein
MAIGAKTWETRGWGTEYRGDVAIAATKSFPGECKELSRTEPFRTVLDAAGIYSPAHLSDVLGHILCVVDLRWIVKVVLGDGRWMTPEAWFEAARDQQAAMSKWADERGSAEACPAGEYEFHFGDYSRRRSIWMTNKLRRLATPIEVTGHQGLRDLDPFVEAEVRKQLP